MLLAVLGPAQYLREASSIEEAARVQPLPRGPEINMRFPTSEGDTWVGLYTRSLNQAGQASRVKVKLDPINVAGPVRPGPE